MLSSLQFDFRNKYHYLLTLREKYTFKNSSGLFYFCFQILGKSRQGNLSRPPRPLSDCATPERRQDTLIIVSHPLSIIETRRRTAGAALAVAVGVAVAGAEAVARGALS